MTTLRMAMVWQDEVMGDVLASRAGAITLSPRRVRQWPAFSLLRCLCYGIVVYLISQLVRWWRSGMPTFVIPDLGLPPMFSIIRPGNRGYLLTLGERMRGTICIDGHEQDVAELFRKNDEGGGQFRATGISGRDWGLVELDESGDYKVFFQFVPTDDPHQFATGPFFSGPVILAGLAGYVISSVILTTLWCLVDHQDLGEAAFRGFGLAGAALIIAAIVWTLLRKDGESIASFSFSIILHAALIFMTYQLYDGEDPFVWPGPRSLTGNYLVTRLDKEEPPPEPPKTAPTVNKQSEQSAAATKEPPKKTATKGEEGRQGGKGDTERARDPNAKDVPPEPPKVGVFEDKNRKILDNIIDKDLGNSLRQFNGIKGDTLTRGSLGFGPGTGTGVGAGNGTGTRGGSKKGGSGGGGNAEGDFVTGPGKIDTGTERPGGGTCKGGGCGTGPKPVHVEMSEPAGDFGGLTAEEIDRVVKIRAGVFRQCYQRELNHTPGIGGKLVIHFKIGGDGAVQAGNTSTASGSTLRNDEVESCIKRNINLLKFPAKGGVANVNYPFVFTQGG